MIQQIIVQNFTEFGKMNDIQLYELYCSIPKWTVWNRSRIYPKYIVITGRAFKAPHPHRHYTFDEFVDKLNEDPNFKNVILNVQENIETVIDCFSKEYSFNIDSELFPALTTEQQKLWKKEIECAVKAGAKYGIRLSKTKVIQ